MSIVNFLAGSVPAVDPAAICAAMNWAQKNNFEITHLVSAMVQTSNGTIARVGQKTAVIPMVFIYARGAAVTFKNYFGKEYDENNIQEYPGIINKIETEKMKDKAA